MVSEEDFYQNQRQSMEKDAVNPDRNAIHESWFQVDTVDFYRHKRMYKTLEPLANFYKKEKWVSIGDGRYGLDSYRLKTMFGIDVLPTDISEGMLKQGKEKGLFNNYCVENAEKLSFEDNSFDVVFCKETLHHLPRPMIAIYEMLRVARKAVIFIEPNDVFRIGSAKSIIKMKLARKPLLKRLIHNTIVDYHFSSPRQSFEISGNYKYAFSRREIVKLALGLDLPGVAWKGINDYYIPGCEFEKATPDNPVFQKIENEIEYRDEECKQNPVENDFALLAFVLFKDQIQDELRKGMINYGFEFPSIIRNPYIHNS